MKKTLKVFSAAAFCAAFAFAGCGNEIKKTVIDDNTSIVITASSDVIAFTADTTVEDYIKVLKEKGKLEFEGNASDYGFYITSMDGTANVDNGDGTGSSWMLYIDFTTLDGDDAIYGSDYALCEYNGKTLYQASYGVSLLPCVEGHTYAFVYEAYDYGNPN